MLNTKNEVEYEERGNEYNFLLIIGLFCECSHVAYTRVHVIYKVNRTECGIHILVVAPQEYVHIYATRRTLTFLFPVSMNRADTDDGFGLKTKRHPPFRRACS